jgi:hypothetical protein
MLKRRLLLCSVAFAIATTGCYEDEAGPERLLDGENSVARVLLTDAPFPYDSVARVDVYVVSVAATTDPDTTGGADWEIIAEPRRVFDLLSLQQGTTALLGEGELSGELYRAIRVIIDANLSAVVWKDTDEPAQVRWPWPWPNGNLITMYALVQEPFFSIADPSGLEIVIDWDVGRSFLFNYYGTAEFTVMPWLRAVHSAFTGTIEGTVTSDYLIPGQPIANANITVYSGNPSQPQNTWWVAATGRTGEDGRYRVAFVSDATYIVHIEQPQYPYLAPVTQSNVVVTSGQTTNVSVSLPEAGESGGAYLRISGPNSVGVGGTITLRAAVGDENGDPVSSPSVTWSSENPTVATVTGALDTAGVHGHEAGFATITALSNGQSDAVTIEVVGAPQPVASVSIQPPTATITLAQTDSAGFYAVLRDAAGLEVRNRPISWFSSNTAVLEVTGSFGEHVLVRARARGTAVLTATSEGKTAQANVTVN